MMATGFALTLFVEIMVMKGDIGRMNTVFKIYMQAWSLLALSSASGLCALIPVAFRYEKSGVKTGWKIALSLLFLGAALFPIMAGYDKIRDRMSTSTPLTLDGSKYMLSSTYSENGVTMNLSEDYYAIQWMQQNIQGSPVIVEGNVPEYRWGTRFTIYTGLPGVVGWNWHQRQQRGVYSADEVQQRVNEVGEFYQTTDIEIAQEFLAKYNVKYIIVGQLEKAVYPADGLRKFEQWSGVLWQEAYHHGKTVIYEVGG